MAQGPEAWQRRLKEEKERERAVKTKTAELHQNFRAKGLNEADTKLAALKQEERRKQQETAEMWRKFKKLEIGEQEVMLSKMKEEERKRLQETERMYHTYQNNTIQESDMKLSLLRQEDRKRMQEHEERLRQYQGTSAIFGLRDDLRKTSSDRELHRSGHDQAEPAAEEKMPTKEELQSEIKTGSVEKTVEAIVHPNSPRRSRRASIGAVSGNSWITQKKEVQAEAPAPPPSPAPTSLPAPPIAQALETKVETNTTPSRKWTPSYLRKDSGANSLIADPILDEKELPVLETPEPSERVEVAEQLPTPVATQSTSMQAARNMFSRNTSGNPLLPPKHNAHVASKSPVKKEPKFAVKSPTPPIEKEEIPLVEATPEPTPEPSEPPVKTAEEKVAVEDEEVQVEELTTATFVRLDVLFSFGLLTSSDTPVFTNYMDAVEKIVKRTISKSETLTQYVWYDPVYPPFVQDYKTDDSYKDPSGRGNVRRLVVIAAIPIFLQNGISVRDAREGVCLGLQGAISTGEFIRLAKTSNNKKSSS